jgi:hypothetical protein
MGADRARRVAGGSATSTAPAARGVGGRSEHPSGPVGASHSGGGLDHAGEKLVAC